MKNWHFTFKMVEKTFVWPKLFKHTLARYISQENQYEHFSCKSSLLSSPMGPEL